MTVRVECLRCGSTRTLARRARGHIDGSDCPRCGYVGWAAPADLSESARRALRERPPERRRLRAVA